MCLKKGQGKEISFKVKSQKMVHIPHTVITLLKLQNCLGVTQQQSMVLHQIIDVLKCPDNEDLNTSTTELELKHQDQAKKYTKTDFFKRSLWTHERGASKMKLKGLWLEGMERYNF